MVWIVKVNLALGYWYYAHKSEAGADSRAMECRAAGYTVSIIKLEVND